MDIKEPSAQDKGSISTFKVSSKGSKKEEQNRYSELFDLIKSGVAVYMAVDDGIDFIIVDINKAVERIESVIKKDVIGKKVTEVFTGVGPFGLLDVFRRVWRSGVPEQFPAKLYQDDRMSGWRDNYVYRSSDGNVIAVYDDLTELRGSEEERLLNERRLESLYRISIYEKDDIQDFLDLALDEAIQLTGSKIGYLYFYDTMKKEFTLNSWSKDVVKECTIQEKQTVYQLERTGIWGEAVRQGRPIIKNDFQAPDPLKKGYPEGHAPLSKFLTIPIFHKNVIEGVVGVANKETDYNSSDVRQLTLLMNYVWELKKKKDNENVIKHLASFPELNPHLVMEFGPSGAVKYLNPAAKKVFRGIEDKVYEMIFPDGQESFKGQFIDPRGVIEREFILHGKTYQIEISNPGDTGSFRAYAVDISDRKRAKETLEASEQRYRRLFEAAQDGILILDADTGVIEDVNPFILDLLGYTKENLMGKELWELGLFKDIADSRDGFIELQKKGYIRYESLPLRANNGSKREVEFVSNIYPVGNKMVVQCNIRDITERKRAEDELISSKLMIEGIINAIPVRVFWKDKDLVFQGCNSVFAQDAGFSSPLDVIGKDDHQMVWREQAELYRNDDLQVIKSGSSKLMIEEPQTTPDGNIITLLTSKVPLRNKSGDIIGVIGTYMDITELKKVQEEVRDLNSFLLSIRNVNQTIIMSDDFKVLLTETARTLAETRGYQDITVAYRMVIDGPIEQRSCKKEGPTGHRTTDWATSQVPPCMEEVFRTGIPRTFDSHSTGCEKCNMYNAEDEHEHILVPIKAEDGPVLAVIQIRLTPGRKLHREEMNLLLEVAGDLAYAHRQIGTENELKRSQSRNKAMLEGMGESLLVVAPEGYILHVNNNALRMFGWKDIEEALRSRICDIFPDSTAAKVLDHISEVLRTGKTEEDEVRTEVNGEDRVLRTRFTAVPFGSENSLSILMLTIDITDQYISREKLREQEEEYRKLIMSTSEGFWRVDKQGITVDVNEALTSMLDFKKEELLGRSPLDLLDISNQALYKEMSDSGDMRDNRVYELDITRKDGEVIHTRVNAASMAGKDGKVTGSFALITDITELKNAYHRLEMEKVRSETLLDLLGHDISNIHQGVILSLEVAMSDSFPEQKRMEAMKTVRSLSKRSINLARNILIISKLAEKEPVLEPIDLTRVLKNAMKTSKEAFPERTIEYKMGMPKGSVEIMAEPIIEELFFNIFHNAIKFQVNDPAVIEVKIITKDGDGTVRIEISDHGPGIPNDMRPYIFDRSRDPSKKLMSGIGLSLVKKLAERFSGKVEIMDPRSEGHPSGVMFSVELPQNNQNTGSVLPYT